MADLEKEHDILQRRYDSLCEGMVAMEKEREGLMNQNNILVAEKKQWEQQKAMQEQIITQHLGSSDSKVRGLEEEIVRLKARLKGVDR